MIENYTLSCPCLDTLLEGALVKLLGDGDTATGLPNVGAFVGCKCGCLHRVHLVDPDARLIALAKLTVDEQLDAYADMGHDLVRVGCPHCDTEHVTECPDGFDPIDVMFMCPACYRGFLVDGRSGHDLHTRVPTDDELREARLAAEQAARARAFGSWQSGTGGNATGSTPFGTDPFSTFGRGGA